MMYNINGTEFYIEEYEGGYGWLTDTEESKTEYDTELEALQDAINHMQAEIIQKEIDDQQNMEDEIYGTMEEQARKLYYETR